MEEQKEKMNNEETLHEKINKEVENKINSIIKQGIKPENIDKLFNKFERMEEDRKISYITKEINKLTHRVFTKYFHQTYQHFQQRLYLFLFFYLNY